MNPTDKKVYYVIKYGIANVPAVLSENNTLDPAGSKTPTQFGTVSEAVAAIANYASKCGVTSWGKRFWKIVRVEETPGVTELRIVSKDQIDPRKPVVLYDRDRASFVGKRDDGMLEAHRMLSTATVFADLEDALIAFADNFVDVGRKRGYITRPLSPHIYQVEYVGTAPTITETVLA